MSFKRIVGIGAGALLSVASLAAAQTPNQGLSPEVQQQLLQQQQQAIQQGQQIADQIQKSYAPVYGLAYGFGMIWTLLWWGISILIGILILRWVLKRFRGAKDVANMLGSKSPMDTLKERYAKGEMTQQEFEEKKRQLM